MKKYDYILVEDNQEDIELIQEAIEAGVISYLMKDISIAKLIEAIHAAYRGESMLDQKATQSLLRAARNDVPAYDLTPAEKRVLTYVARGLSNAEIARELSVSKSTIKKHVSHILSKLDVSNRAEAAVRAVRHQLIDVDEPG